MKNPCTVSVLVCLLLSVPRVVSGQEAPGGSVNLIPNGRFHAGAVGTLPQGWQMVAARPGLAPEFMRIEKDGGSFLLVSGNGDPDCVGYVHTKAAIELGKTYLFSVRFQFSEDLNPLENLLFQSFHGQTKNGIFSYSRLNDNWAFGQEKIYYPGTGTDSVEIRIVYRLHAHAKVWIQEISLVETTSVTPHWVTVACTEGKTDLDACEQVLDVAGRSGVDLVLLPEYMRGDMVLEALHGQSFALMSKKAKQYGMHVAGGIVRMDEEGQKIYNTAVLFDRNGACIGTYDKIHPYSQEINEHGITPGTRLPVFHTDMGTLGIMICYDSWFTDVIELLALKGADMVLFPNAGYYRSLMPARAADNGVRIVSSTLYNECGVWDTAGRDVLDPDADASVKPVHGTTFKNVIRTSAGDIQMLIVSLDMTQSPSPHYNGGTMFSAPAGRRNRRDQKIYLEEEIQKERKRWWSNAYDEN